MNPRQRRGVLFLLLATLIGVGVFISVTSYVANVASKVGSLTTVYRAATTIDPYVPLSGTNLEAVEVPQRWSSPTSRLALRDLEGRRVGFRLAPGTVISSDMLIPPSALSPTEREIAINVSAVTGIGGRVRPGDSVDIYAVFEQVPGLPDQVRVLVRNVRVVSIGGQQTLQQQDSDGIRDQKVLPVTLALEPKEALGVTYANTFAKEVRLVGLPTDVGTSRGQEPDTFDVRQLGGRAIVEKKR